MSFIQTSFIIQISYHVSSSCCQQTFANFTIKLWHLPDENQRQMLVYMPTGITPTQQQGPFYKQRGVDGQWSDKAKKVSCTGEFWNFRAFYQSSTTVQ